MATGPRVDIDIVRKRFDVLPTDLLRGFRLTVAPSTVVALVGPSGVGKSSLLRMIAGVDNDYEGSIGIAGEPAATARPPGFVFQDPRLLPWLTAIENILAVDARTSVDKAAQMLGRVGLAGYERAYPHELSGGMQRRVGLARAFSVNPGLLLLDEPFVSLDRQLVVEMQQVFLDLIRDSSPTVILVTHLPEDAARLADRAVVLHGRPAGIVADLHFPVSRSDRGAADIEKWASEISRIQLQDAP